VKVKDQCQVKISNRFAALENLDDDDDDDDDDDMERLETWYSEECSKLLDQRTLAKLQWLQYPNQINGDVKLVVFFRKKKMNI
jgi:hypothetical protein